MQYIQYSIEHRIAYITLNRPEKRNALNHAVVSELKEAFTQAEQDEHVKVIVLRATGEAFCAGADLAYLQQLQQFTHEENRADSNHLKELFYKIYTLNKVVIAQVQGNALAGGCGLANVCDFVFAVPEARFGYTEVKIGFIPAIVMIFLIRKIGEAHARQLLLTGELITAERAHELGLVTTLSAKEKIEADVTAFAQRLITQNSAQAMSTTKKMINEVQGMKLDEALTFAVEMNALARATEDCKRGISAFVSKEKIIW